MPLRRLLLTLLAAPALAALPAPAPGAEPAFWLVTPEEAAAGRIDGEVGRPPTRSLGEGSAPVIEIIEPREAPTLPSPLTIRLRFRAPSGTAIIPSSFRAVYGLLGLDITSRLLQHARVDANGLVLENVAIPAGTHRITLRVADATGRVGERAFRFTIAER
ncbi:hypothetical protein [Muricoccus radiodurans]|uniref:hypothetical protein n=1 Tax=Muricoccus radiodurans TaxID=2231721 RepID=UPI003CEC83A8